MSLDKNQLRSLLGGLRIAEKKTKVEHKGTSTTSPSTEISSISTSSVIFRDQLIVALMHAGYSAYFVGQNPSGDDSDSTGSVDKWSVFYTDLPSDAAQS